MQPGSRLKTKTIFPRYGDSHYKDNIFNMGIPILVRRHLYIEMALQIVLHIEAQWRIYASVHWVNISSGYGFVSVLRLAITWTNVNLLSYGVLGTTSMKWKQNKSIGEMHSECLLQKVDHFVYFLVC